MIVVCPLRARPRESIRTPEESAGRDNHEAHNMSYDIPKRVTDRTRNLHGHPRGNPGHLARTRDGERVSCRRTYTLYSHSADSDSKAGHDGHSKSFCCHGLEVVDGAVWVRCRCPALGFSTTPPVERILSWGRLPVGYGLDSYSGIYRLGKPNRIIEYTI
jgi:hypothetical protein